MGLRVAGGFMTVHPLQFWLALYAARSASWLSRTLNRGEGTSLPGKIALRLNPAMLRQLGQPLRQGQRIGVTGTNGKSTTAGLLARFLALSPQNRVLHNTLGANMMTGITTALLRLADARGHLSATHAVLEVDEASLAGVAGELPLSDLIVTNLFRDQLDRYGELDTTAKLIAQAFGQVETAVWLNADDPLVAHMADQLPTEKTRFYGMINLPDGLTPDETTLDIGPGFPLEVTDCPRCGTPLDYSLRVYAQLGHYRCPACGFHRPEPTVAASITTFSANGATLHLYRDQSEPATLTVNMPGLYNLYNVVAAASVALASGVNPRALQAGLDSYEGLFGRAEERTLNGRRVRVLLIKNPAGATEVLRLVTLEPTAHVWVAINDNYADGRDVSWLWDAPFEWLAQQQAAPITVSGHRAEDMAVRLVYGGVDPSRVRCEPDLVSSLRQAVDATPQGGTLYVLPTYTVLLALRFLWDRVG